MDFVVMEKKKWSARANNRQGPQRKNGAKLADAARERGQSAAEQWPWLWAGNGQRMDQVFSLPFAGETEKGNNNALSCMRPKFVERNRQFM